MVLAEVKFLFRVAQLGLIFVIGLLYILKYW